MSKLILCVLFFSSTALAEAPIKSIQIKPGECEKLVAPLICYDEVNAAKQQEASRIGFECALKLTETQSQLNKAKAKECPPPLEPLEALDPWWQTKWFYLAIGVTFGLGLGMIVGASSL